MKKKVIGIFAVLAIVALSAYNVNFNKEKEQLSVLALANIQALANVEDLTDGETGSGQRNCYNSITSEYLSRVFYCGTCSWVDGTSSWFSGKGKCSGY